MDIVFLWRRMRTKDFLALPDILEKDNFSSGRSLWGNKLKDSYSKKEENQMVLRFLSEAKKKIDANTEPRCMYAMYMYD